MFSSAWWHFVLLFIYLSRIQLATSQDLEIAVVPIQTDNQSGHTTVVVTEIPPLTTPWIIPEDCKTASLSLKKSYNVTYTVSNTPLVHVAQQTLSFFADHCAVGKRSCCPPGWEPGGFYQQTAPPGYTLLSSASIDPQQGIHFNTHMKVVGERTERAQFACPTEHYMPDATIHESVPTLTPIILYENAGPNAILPRIPLCAFISTTRVFASKYIDSHGVIRIIERYEERRIDALAVAVFTNQGSYTQAIARRQDTSFYTSANSTFTTGSSDINGTVSIFLIPEETGSRSSNNDAGSSLSKDKIAGIGVGAGAGALVLFGLAFLGYRRRLRQRKDIDMPTPEPAPRFRLPDRRQRRTRPQPNAYGVGQSDYLADSGTEAGIANDYGYGAIQEKGA